MSLRITLTEPGVTVTAGALAHRPPPGERSAGPFLAEWDVDSSEALHLFVADDPAIGLRFTYEDLEWEVVDYRDGWVASLVVDPGSDKNGEPLSAP